MFPKLFRKRFLIINHFLKAIFLTKRYKNVFENFKNVSIRVLAIFLWIETILW